MNEQMKKLVNVDAHTVEGFGEEWSSFDQQSLSIEEKEEIFNKYFNIFPFDFIDTNSVGVDIGCGSGRWASVIAQRVKVLHLVDASEKALGIAKIRLSEFSGCEYHHASASELPFANESLDFAYSLGVLHHIPDTADAINHIATKLKQGSPLLLYLYYSFDNRPKWYGLVWSISNTLRKGISLLPYKLRLILTQIIALFVYYPLSRMASLLEYLKIMPKNWPLAFYRNRSFYTMRTDALDRFGTKLEQRFSKVQIEKMFLNAGFDNVIFSDKEPFWCAVATKK
jgi:ubiquinone/menaquinone biosynthesis C-methylase UbiE